MDNQPLNKLEQKSIVDALFSPDSGEIKLQGIAKSISTRTGNKITEITLKDKLKALLEQRGATLEVVADVLTQALTSGEIKTRLTAADKIMKINGIDTKSSEGFKNVSQSDTMSLLVERKKEIAKIKRSRTIETKTTTEDVKE